jgi:hypothetical protein
VWGEAEDWLLNPAAHQNLLGELFISIYYLEAGDWTQGHIHGEHLLYHWATLPALGKLLKSKSNLLILIDSFSLGKSTCCVSYPDSSKPGDSQNLPSPRWLFLTTSSSGTSLLCLEIFKSGLFFYFLIFLVPLGFELSAYAW